MATLSPKKRMAFRHRLGSVQKAIRAGVVSSRTQKSDTNWAKWTTFCNDLGHDNMLTSIADPVPFVQAFSDEYRQRPGTRRKFVIARTVEDVIRSAGQTLAFLGARDCRKTPYGDIDIRIKRQINGYAKSDDPPHRVKPLPILVVHHILQHAYSSPHHTTAQAIADCITIAFFFLLRPGEYTGTTSDGSPFRIADVQLFLGRRRIFGIELFRSPEADLLRATAVSLTFTNQKNSVRGEIIHQGASGSSLA